MSILEQPAPVTPSLTPALTPEDAGISVLPRERWDTEQLADIAKFREQLVHYLDGSLGEDVFRVFRLNNGIYGQRQGGTNQMVRVKVPYGSMTPEQLEMMAFIGERYSRGWGHITTRQNIQFHFIQLADIPDVMEHLASVGLTSREACGDTVRNIQGCHLAGACPQEVLDITQWAEAAYQHFVRNPLGQRLPRKFKINFSGCSTDCGQAMFNDAGVVAVTRTVDDGHGNQRVERGFRIYIAGGLGATPHPALALEEFTPREQLLPTIEAILRVFDQAGNRDNKLRARLKWLIDTLGFDEVQRRVFNVRRFLLASSSWPGGIPPEVAQYGDAPAGVVSTSSTTLDGKVVELVETTVVTKIGQGVDGAQANPVPVSVGGLSPYVRWYQANVVLGVANGSVSAYAYAPLGDITSDQFRALAKIQRDFSAGVRLTNRQNVVFRDLAAERLPELYERLTDIGMAAPGAELARDVVACPGADTCNLAVTQSRGLAKAIGERLDEEGLAEVGGVRINISGCTNSCGQHHASDIGFFGAERRADGRSAPGYQMLLGGYVGQEQIHFGDKALRLPAKNAAEGAVRVIRRYAGERAAGETFRSWLDRSGGAKGVAEGLAELDRFPSFAEDPDYYTDFGETGPYVAEVGESECAT